MQAIKELLGKSRVPWAVTEIKEKIEIRIISKWGP